jgi:creatinine amidohydrolase
MRTVRFELLRPHEILEEKSRCPVVYLPIGPLEWHGPHLALGTDPLNAEAVSRRVAEEVGGVVMPTFYWGTERERSPQMLRNMGFTGDEWIVGMDFPANAMPSLYAVEDAFAAAVREMLNLLVKQGYKLIVIINGHGSENHVATLLRLAAEFTATTDSKVIYTMSTILNETLDQDFGHAAKVETSILQYLYPDSVDLGQLPPMGEKLYSAAHAIVDGAAFGGNPSPDFTVQNDPRDATPELGGAIVEASVSTIVATVREALGKISV